MANEFILNNVDDLMQITSFTHDHFAETNKPLRVKITTSGKRSLNQNQLMWMWYGELVEQIKTRTGDVFSSDDLHELMKQKFCPDRVLTFGNKEISVKSTKRLDRGEMHHYLNQLHNWAVNAGFKLTLPIDSEYQKIIEEMNR